LIGPVRAAGGCADLREFGADLGNQPFVLRSVPRTSHRFILSKTAVSSQLGRAPWASARV
jgi:hypothetical protein